jgi:membrane protease YdiL (CAAX protease family)
MLARHPLVSYFVLAYGGAWAVWATFILSQDGAGLLEFRAPLSYMATIALGIGLGPFLSSFVMSYVTAGDEGVRSHVRAISHWRVGFRWYGFVLVGIPLIMSLGTIVLPGVWESLEPLSASEIVAYPVFFLYPALLIGGPLGEEPGWRGFALPRLQQRVGPLAGSLILGPLWACWHMPIWFSGQWTVPSLLNIATYIGWLTAMTVIMTWVHNRTRGSVWMAILSHTSMDAFPNAILWPLFPAVAQITGGNVLYGYLGLLLAYGVAAALLIALTKGTLGYAANPSRPLDPAVQANR